MLLYRDSGSHGRVHRDWGGLGEPLDERPSEDGGDDRHQDQHGEDAHRQNAHLQPDVERDEFHQTAGIQMLPRRGDESEALGVITLVPVETGLDRLAVSGADVAGVEQGNGLALGFELGNEPGRCVCAALGNM